MIKVWLTPREIRWAKEVGLARHLNALDKGYRDANGCTMGLEAHQMGAAGEIAVAKALDRYWSGHVNTFKGPDLSERMQVRCRREHHRDLFVFPKDKDDQGFVLVTGGMGPEMWVHGWFMAHEAKQPEFYVEQFRPGAGPAWIVKQGLLHQLTQKVTA